jgi:predicted dithiol-disulfide oxidoreductase (DUF899 family)
MREVRDYTADEYWDEPMLNVFRKDGGTIRHFWGSELVFSPDEPGQDHRGLDFADPVWGLLDTTPEGRGGDWFPSVDYPAKSEGRPEKKEAEPVREEA